MMAGDALAEAARQRLAGVKALNGCYDGPPQRATVPFAIVEAGTQSDWGHKSGAGREVRLTLTLRDLERDGFVTRTMFATIPPRVDYELTSLGRELLKLADGLKQFAARNADQVLAARQRFDAAGGEPVVRLVHPQ